MLKGLLNEKQTRGLIVLVVLCLLFFTGGFLCNYLLQSRRDRQLLERYAETELLADSTIKRLELELQFAGGALEGIGESIDSLTGITESNDTSIQGARRAVANIRTEVNKLQDIIGQWRNSGIAWDHGWYNDSNGKVKKADNGSKEL
jgi:hypothetical protein